MLPLPAVMLGVPVPANVTSVPSHTADVGVVFVAALGAEFTVKLASDVVCGHDPFAATVYLIVTVSFDAISPVT